ncbi:hypothetical protein SAMN05216338_104553 [Bradyrhizobium sp. Rc2d]|uniref:hypothetical protein n=1 Tax=Bradyrhizobium sp. Rc2d TaxID=1855321 RepID=UPI00088AF208|nr:hypothetical protein [Bradyrhizobium sp. Rc2d]SDJ30318.1 hypothetical protein SAMN05216338_104553 [Bradyrhizobium sp. Rc2d]
MKRREFIGLLAWAAASSDRALAELSGRVRHIGILLFADQDRAVIAPLLQQLERLGYIDGKTVAIEYQ